MKHLVENTQMENLAFKLIELIKKRQNILNPITIIIPDKKIEIWFKKFWLKNFDEVLMNINFKIIEDALFEILNNKHYQKLTKRTKTSLLTKIIVNHQDILPLDIKNYLENLNPLKLYDLSNNLSNLFDEYEKDNFIFNGFQKQIYDLLQTEAKNYNLITLNNLFHQTPYIKINTFYFFGFINFSNLEDKIIDYIAKTNEVYIFKLKKQKNQSQILLYKAPSKLRETENLHTQICRLINKENAEYSDIIVVAPEINQYQSQITRVFNQDNINFPSIPFIIEHQKQTQSLTFSGLKLLFDIYLKGYFTRYDFFNIVNNSFIKKQRNLNDEEIQNFLDSIIKMNCYRNYPTSDDWEYVKNRVLLAKVVDNNQMIELSNQTYLPYSNIQFNDQAIIKFVKLIDDLKEWIFTTSKINYINNEKLELLQGLLKNWFSILDDNNFEQNNDLITIINLLETWKKLSISNDNISLKTLFYFLLDENNQQPQNSLSYNGILFTNFNQKAIVQAKYVFFLNASSNELPKLRLKNELDLRPYDVSNINQQAEAFLIQVQNSSKFYISYIHKNLKNDEDFYPSTFVEKIIDLEKTISISLDETREWSYLYTNNEYKNKDYFNNLLTNNDKKVENNPIFNQEEPLKKIKVKDIVDFLVEPLQYKYNHLLKKTSNIEQDIKDEYEPFTLDNLTSYKIRNQLVMHFLKQHQFIDQEIDNFQKLYNLEHFLPMITKEINQYEMNTLKNESNEIITNIIEKTNNSYQIIKLEDILFNHPEQWILITDDEICCYQENNTIYYYLLKNLKNQKKSTKDIIKQYILALINICKKPQNNYHLVLDNLDIDFNISPDEANKILEQIYLLINDYENIYYLPFELVQDSKNIKSFQDLLNSIYQHNYQDYELDYRKIFDLYQDLGYTKENFNQEFKKLKKLTQQLFKFIKEEGDEDENI